MPRRALPIIASAPVTALLPPPPPSPLVQRLRTDWRWAGISQFIWTFSDAFGLLDWDIEALEADLDGDETALLPDLLAKMLYALTYNRQINRDNAFVHLHKQYLKRVPGSLMLGTEDEPRAWATLGLGDKVQLLWEVCEWQMMDPARFRALLKSEEEATSWRIEPVGWDKDGNTYFLFDDNRLWIQRQPPPPPRPAKKTSQKAKRALKRTRPSQTGESHTDTPHPKSASHKKRIRSPELTPPPPLPIAADDETPVLSGRRERKQVAFYGNPTDTVQALKRGTPSGSASTPTGLGAGSRGTRSSARASTGASTSTAAAPPAQAQSTPSRASASRPGATALAGPSSIAQAAAPVSAPRSTRASQRARGAGEEWQPIPAEWLQPESSSSLSATLASSRSTRQKAAALPATTSNKERAGAKGKRKRGEDEESELSALTDEEEHEARLRSVYRPGQAGEESATTEHGRATREDTPLTDLDSPTPPLAPPIDTEDASATKQDGTSLIQAPLAGRMDDVGGDLPNEPEQGADVDMEAAIDESAVGEEAKGIAQALPSDVASVGAPVRVAGAGTSGAPASPTEEKDNLAGDTAPKAMENDISPTAIAPAEHANSNEEAISAKGASVVQNTQDEAEPMANGANKHKQPELVLQLGDDHAKIETKTEEAEIANTAVPAPTQAKVEVQEEEEETDEVKLAVKEAKNLPAGFVEWEAVCVTLYDWRTFPERFAHSRHPDEKHLHHLLVEQVGPKVIEALVAKEQERLRQEAINNRKRSSRIAVKELEREEIARRQLAQREMEERMDRSRRDEALRLKAEAATVNQERAREDRVKEREERIAAREEAAAARLAEEQRAKEKGERARLRRQRRREGEVVESSSEEEGPSGPANGKEKRGRGTGTPQAAPAPTPVAGKADDGWELNCEICRKTGWNLDDEEDVVCCDDCGRWQHTECHNRQDASEGRPLRNWEMVDFKCKDCRRRAARKRQRLSAEGQPSSSPVSTPQRNGGSYTGQAHPAQGPAPVPNGAASAGTPHQAQRYTPQQHSGQPSRSQLQPYPQHQQQQQRGVVPSVFEPPRPLPAMQTTTYAHTGQQAPLRPASQGYPPHPTPQAHYAPNGQAAHANGTSSHRVKQVPVPYPPHPQTQPHHQSQQQAYPPSQPYPPQTHPAAHPGYAHPQQAQHTVPPTSAAVGAQSGGYRQPAAHGNGPSPMLPARQPSYPNGNTAMYQQSPMSNASPRGPGSTPPVATRTIHTAPPVPGAVHPFGPPPSAQPAHHAQYSHPHQHQHPYRPHQQPAPQQQQHHHPIHGPQGQRFVRPNGQPGSPQHRHLPQPHLIPGPQAAQNGHAVLPISPAPRPA